MFQPDHVIFAPTSRCNLVCGHCRVTRVQDELDADAAIRFLRDCAEHGIERVGFSGGEPFLKPDVLMALSREAVSLGLCFDRLMTNAVWYGNDEIRLNATLRELEEAGFDGTFGISVDAWHGQDSDALADFIQRVFSIWRCKDCVELLSAADADDVYLGRILLELAHALGGCLVYNRRSSEPGCRVSAVPIAIEDDLRDSARRTGLDDPASLYVRLHRFPVSSALHPSAAMTDDAWFEDDLCAGPGNVFYVHPDRSVAICCGFANEHPALKLGLIEDGVPALLERAAASTAVHACFSTGLGALRSELERVGVKFPGMTKDMCLFCDYVARNNLFASSGVLPQP